MKTEITDKMIEDAMICGICETCAMCNFSETKCITEISKALQAERAERKAMHDVWEGAPEWATETYRIYKDDKGTMRTGTVSTRELPKSPERLIAEIRAKEFVSTWERYAECEKELADAFEKIALEAKGKLG